MQTYIGNPPRLAIYLSQLDEEKDFMVSTLLRSILSRFSGGFSDKVMMLTVNNGIIFLLSLAVTR